MALRSIAYHIEENMTRTKKALKSQGWHTDSTSLDIEKKENRIDHSITFTSHHILPVVPVVVEPVDTTCPVVVVVVGSRVVVVGFRVVVVGLRVVTKGCWVVDDVLCSCVVGTAVL